MSIRNRVGTDVGKVKKSDIYMWILLGVFAGYVGICLSNTFVEGEISVGTPRRDWRDCAASGAALYQ